MSGKEANKIEFGLSNVHYAVITKEEIVEGKEVITYDTPKRIQGAVSLNLNTEGDDLDIYADDGKYYSESMNLGYSGTLEIYQLPLDFKTSVLGMELTEDGTLLENSNTTTKNFALLFQVLGDKHKNHTKLFKCSVSRPNDENQTKGEATEGKLNSLEIKVLPTAEGNVKETTTASTSEEVIANWYKEV